MRLVVGIFVEYTARNIKYIILFSIDIQGHVIRGGYNGGYD